MASVQFTYTSNHYTMNLAFALYKVKLLIWNKAISTM